MWHQYMIWDISPDLTTHHVPTLHISTHGMQHDTLILAGNTSSSPDRPTPQGASQCRPSHHHPNDLTGAGPRVRQWCLWYCVQGEGEGSYHACGV